jgi:hypothetical protein
MIEEFGLCLGQGFGVTVAGYDGGRVCHIKGYALILAQQSGRTRSLRHFNQNITFFGQAFEPVILRIVAAYDQQNTGGHIKMTADLQ